LKLSSWPALLSGLCYLLSGLFIAMLLRWWIPGSFAWFPFLLLGTSSLLKRFSPCALALCALMLAFSFLDGFFQTSASLLLAWGTYLLVTGWQRSRFNGMVQATLRGTAVALLAFLLSAVMWIPQLEYFYFDLEKGSSRTAGLYFQKSFWERILSVPALAAAFFPQLLGSPQTLDLGKLFHTHLQDFAPFVGTLPLLFALSVWRLRREKPEWKPLWSLVFLGILVPIVTPLDRYLYFRFLAVYVVGICALAGLGFEHVLAIPNSRSLAKVKKAGLLLAAGITAGALALRAFLWIKPGWLEKKAAAYVGARLDQVTIGAKNPEWMLERARAFVRFYALGYPSFLLPLLLVFCAIFLLYLWQRNRIRRAWFIAGVFAITGLQLAHGVHVWFGFHSLEKYPLFPDNEVAQFMRSADPLHEFRTNVDDFNGLKEKELQIIISNTNFFYGYYAIEGFDGVRPGTIYDLPSFGHYRLLGQLNVKYIITNPEPPLRDPALILRQKKIVAIYENSFAQPRARLFHSFKVEKRDQIRTQVLKGPISEETVLLEELPEGLNSEEKIPENVVRLESDLRNISRYQVDGAGPGLVLASETYYPGWHAFWNGAPVKVLRANGYMRAVAIPSGKGILEFRFEPESYALGLRVTGCTAVLWLLLMIWGAATNLRAIGRKD
jgi:hypothetical protein